MKKTLAAVAVLGAFAGSALAADVTLYGVVDTGFQYNHIDADIEGLDATDSFSMESGQQSGSRFGLKGTEELGNGLTVGFILENGLSSDTGVDKGVFFDRESSLFLQGGFGKVAAGRLGAINNGTSSWGRIGAASAFGTSFGIAAQASTTFSTAGVKDNMIAYESPSFAGFKVLAQYAMGSNDTENKSGSDRYYAVGATYNNGPVALYFAVDSTNYKTAGLKANDLVGRDDVDDSLTVTFAGNYNFDVAKVYFGAQYFDEAKLSSIGGLCNTDAFKNAVAGQIDVDDLNHDLGTTYKNGGEIVTALYGALKLKGYGLNLSASAPVLGGNAMFGVGYVDAEQADSIDDAGLAYDFTRYVVSAGYTYSFSKRTNVYGVVSYTQDKLEVADEEIKPTATSVMLGLRHFF